MSTTEIQPGEAQRAYGVHSRILGALADGRDALWRLAEALYEFEDMQGWVKLGYDTKEEWLADSDVTMTKGTYHRLVRTWRKLVVERQIDSRRLRELDQSKVAIVADAITDNKVTVDEALNDAAALPARDLREKYYGPRPERPTLDEDPTPPAESDGPTDDDLPSDDELGLMSDAEVEAAVAEEEARTALQEQGLTTASVDGAPVVAEILDAAPDYDYPGWVTKGEVEAMLSDLRFGIDSGAAFPRLSRRGCQVAEQLAMAWLAMRQN